MRRFGQQPPLRGRGAANRARRTADAEKQNEQERGDMAGADDVDLSFLDQVASPPQVYSPLAAGPAGGLTGFQTFIINDFANPSQPGSSRGAAPLTAASPASPKASESSDVEPASPETWPVQSPGSQMSPASVDTSYFDTPVNSPPSPASMTTEYFHSQPTSPASPPAAPAAGPSSSGGGRSVCQARASEAEMEKKAKT